MNTDVEDRLEISCPHCGGTSNWKLLQSLSRCEYCGSVLYRVYHEDEPQYLVAESTVQDPSQIIDVLATYDAMRVVSRRRADLHAYDDRSALRVDLGSGFADTEIYEVKEQRKHLFRILDSHSMHVPYLLLCSTLVFHVLGRVGGGSRKVYRSIFFTSEDVVPAYGGPWDFRDRGLAISLRKLKPFQPEMQKQSQFLAPVLLSVKDLDPAGQWKKQRAVLTHEIDPICFEAFVVDLRRWVVFRPYAFVHAQTPDGTNWYLIDKQFGTIAGDPKTQEVERVRAKRLPMLKVTGNLLLQVKPIPFRCPECGWDVEINIRATYQICSNCTRLLETTEHGLRLCNYRFLESIPWQCVNSHSSAWLPFWRCSMKTTLEGTADEDLSLLINRLIPPSPLRKVAFRKQWKAIFVPAFESWPYDRYDRWAFQTAMHLSASDSDLLRSNLLSHGTQQEDEIIPPFYPAAVVKALLPRLLPFYFPEVLHSQLNRMLLTRLAQMQIQIETLELVYVPIPLQRGTRGGLSLVGPISTVEYEPLKTGNWPPVLQRTVRRWRAMAEESESSKISIRKSRWMSQ